MDVPTWIQYVTAIGTVATPILVAVLTVVGWRLRNRLERQAQLEDQLRTDRIGIYNVILEPFIILLTTDASWQSDPKHKNRDKNQIAQDLLLSIDYRRKAFQMSLVGSDGVVKAYNDLMQFFYREGSHPGPQTTEQTKTMMALLGGFLLEIRRSMGNEATSLQNWDMLEWFMTDARKWRS